MDSSLSEGGPAESPGKRIICETKGKDSGVPIAVLQSHSLEGSSLF